MNLLHGAATFQSWTQELIVVGGSTFFALQWGRDLSVTETCA